VEVVRTGWISTIAWGIILAAIIPWLILFGLIVLFVFVGVGGAALHNR
jgi:hypothetical protein